MKPVHPETQTDDQLLEQFVQDGDREAFTALVDRHRTGLINFLYRMVGKANDAEDLAQETFIRVYRSAAKYDRRGRFRPWLYRIARNLVVDQHRKLSRMQLVSPEIFDETQADHQTETNDEVFFLLNQMSDRDRSLLVMAHMDSFSYGEIAESLGISEKAVSVGLTRARERFRKLSAAGTQGA